MSDLINCVYDLKIFDDVVLRLYKCGIEVVVYIINGFLIEDKNMMLEIVKYLNMLFI